MKVKNFGTCSSLKSIFVTLILCPLLFHETFCFQSCDASWIGAAKFGNDDIFSEWKSFAENWKNKPHRLKLIYGVITILIYVDSFFFTIIFYQQKSVAI